MTSSQEEALYEFLDMVTIPFSLATVVSFVRKKGARHINHLAEEIEAFIDLRKLAFPAGDRRWVSRRGFFEPLSFVISPSRLELVNGILIPGHRCVPFANAGLLPQEYSFTWQGSAVPFTTTEGPPDEFYPYYSIFGEEYAPQYVARDNLENEAAFNSDPYDDPPEVSIKTLDMRNIYRETSFVPGDRFVVTGEDWKNGIFKLEKAGKDEWDGADLNAWLTAAETGFEESFRNLGPGVCTEEQVAYAYLYGGSRMGKVPAYALEDFLYEKTGRIETTAYGIESRFWYAGREIPDRKELDTGNIRPDKTPVEEILYRFKIPVSEYVIQSYIRDSLYRCEEDINLIIDRIIPPGVDLPDRDWNILAEYIESVLNHFRNFYSAFADNTTGPVRQRMAELHTAVIELVFRLYRGDIDRSWLPRHTFIILSQIQCQAAGVLEDLDSDEGPDETELETMDGSLDSMIETYEEIKELIDESFDSFRRNKLSLVRAGSMPEPVMEHLLQLSIGGIDVWRRLIVPETCTLEELHHIIQTVFCWRNSQSYMFTVEGDPEAFQAPAEASEKVPEKPGASPKIVSFPSFEKEPAGKNPPERGMDPNISVSDIAARDNTALLYEYGTKWTVRVMFLSGSKSPGNKPVRCVAGSGSAPPEFVGGPLRFRRILSVLESGNDMERLGARQELGPDFVPGDFDIKACNRSLNARSLAKGRGPNR